MMEGYDYERGAQIGGGLPPGWDPFREHEPSIGSAGSSEISDLAEDKEIAARAVAFVVNSTRKGVVTLCADVAHLMSSKRRLERKLVTLQHDNGVLRAHFTRRHNLLSSRPCSQCSACTDLDSPSPRRSRKYSARRCSSSEDFSRSNLHNAGQTNDVEFLNGIKITRLDDDEDHETYCEIDDFTQPEIDRRLLRESSVRGSLSGRIFPEESSIRGSHSGRIFPEESSIRGSHSGRIFREIEEDPPKMTNEIHSKSSVMTISPLAHASREVQCDLMTNTWISSIDPESSTSSDNMKSSVSTQEQQLTDELRAAKEEITLMREKILSLETSSCAPSIDEIYIENETRESPSTKTTTTTHCTSSYSSDGKKPRRNTKRGKIKDENSPRNKDVERGSCNEGIISDLCRVPPAGDSDSQFVNSTPISTSSPRRPLVTSSVTSRMETGDVIPMVEMNGLNATSASSLYSGTGNTSGSTHQSSSTSLLTSSASMTSSSHMSSHADVESQVGKTSSPSSKVSFTQKWAIRKKKDKLPKSTSSKSGGTAVTQIEEV